MSATTISFAQSDPGQHFHQNSTTLPFPTSALQTAQILLQAHTQSHTTDGRWIKDVDKKSFSTARPAAIAPRYEPRGTSITLIVSLKFFSLDLQIMMDVQDVMKFSGINTHILEEELMLEATDTIVLGIP